MPGATGSAIKAGEAFVALFVDDNALKRGLKSAASDLKAFGGAVKTIGTGLMAIGGAALAPIAAGFADLMSYASELRGLSAKTGESVETLSALGFAAGRAGVSLDELGAMSKHLNKHLDEATQKGGEADAAFRRLGLSAEELAGMGFEDKVLAIADQFKKLTNDTERSALAQKLFGKSGDETMRFLDKGADGIRKLMQKGRDLGAVLTGEEAAAIKEFQQGLKDLSDSGRFALMSLGKALIPALGDMESLNEKVVSTVKGFRLWIQENGRLIILVFKVATGVVAVGTGLVILGTVITQVGAVIGIVTSLVSGFVGILFSPLGIILALAAGVAYLWTRTEEGRGFMGRIAEDWKSSWGAILAAVQSGDLEGAFKIVVGNMKIAWLDLSATIEEQIDNWFNRDLPDAADAGINKATGSVQEGTEEWDKAFNRSLVTVQGFMAAIYYGWKLIFQAIESGWDATMKFISNPLTVRDNIRNAIKEVDEVFNEFERTVVAIGERKQAEKSGRVKTPAADARAERDAEVKRQQALDAARKFAAAWGQGDVVGKAPLPKALGAALGGLPGHAAVTSSSYALSQSFAISDKISERIADGIDGVNEKLDKLPDKLADKIQPKHG